MREMTEDLRHQAAEDLSGHTLDGPRLVLGEVIDCGDDNLDFLDQFLRRRLPEWRLEGGGALWVYGCAELLRWQRATQRLSRCVISPLP